MIDEEVQVYPPAVPLPRLRGSVRTFKTPEFPEGPFTIIDQNGNEDGEYTASMFVPTNDGDNTHVAQLDSRPIYLRVIRQRGNEIHHVDGEGNMWRYTLRPVTIPAS